MHIYSRPLELIELFLEGFGQYHPLVAFLRSSYHMVRLGVYDYDYSGRVDLFSVLSWPCLRPFNQADAATTVVTTTRDSFLAGARCGSAGVGTNLPYTVIGELKSRMRIHNFSSANAPGCAAVQRVFTLIMNVVSHTIQ